MTEGEDLVKDGVGRSAPSSVEWMRRKEVCRVFGLCADILADWAAHDVVEAHKVAPGRNGTVLYNVESVRRAIRSCPTYSEDRGGVLAANGATAQDMTDIVTNKPNT